MTFKLTPQKPPYYENKDQGLIRNFKALIAQAGTATPTLTILQNNLGITPVVSRIAVGLYRLTASTQPWIINRTTLGNLTTLTGRLRLVISDGASVIGYFTMWISTTSTIDLRFTNAAFVDTEMSTLLGNLQPMSVQIETYPTT